MDLFGSVRDAWIADDLHGWLDANGIYAGLPDDLAAAQKQAELYIVTTKQVSTATSGQMHLAPGNTCMEHDVNSCKQIFIKHPDVGWYMSGAANQVFVAFFVEFTLCMCALCKPSSTSPSLNGQVQGKLCSLASVIMQADCKQCGASIRTA